jgi:hypothetical protein
MLQTSVKVSKRLFPYESQESEFEAGELHILDSEFLDSEFAEGANAEAPSHVTMKLWIM